MKLKDPSLLRSQAYINGAWIDAADGRVFAVNNPADGSLIAEVADLGADSITAAIDAAVPAQKAWAATPAKTRAMILRRWYDLVIENTDDLATTSIQTVLCHHLRVSTPMYLPVNVLRDTAVTFGNDRNGSISGKHLQCRVHEFG